MALDLDENETVATPPAGKKRIALNTDGEVTVIDSSAESSIVATTANSVSSVIIKSPVRAVAVSNITLSGEQTIDGVAVVAGNRVLAAGQSTASQNGVYVAASGAWSRATDFDAASQIETGTIVPIAEGSTYAAAAFMLTTTGAITVGSTNLAFLQLGRLPSYVFPVDTDTGVVRGGADRLDLYAGGLAVIVNANGLTFQSSGVLATGGLVLVGGVAKIARNGNHTQLVPHTGGDVEIGTAAALAVDAASGFLQVPTCAGTPTGTPTPDTGKACLVVDSTNHKLYGFYGAAWHDLIGT
jgi:hypothetical protein